MIQISLLNLAEWAAIGPPLANHLWQSTLFAAVAGLLTLLLRRNHARARHWLWLAASVKFVVPFSFLVAIGSQFEWRTAHAVTPTLSGAIDQISQPFAPPVAPAVSTPAAPPVSPFVPALIAAVWFLGSAAVVLRWCVCWRRIQTAVRTASPLSLRAPIEVMSSPTHLEPGVFGIFRPVLLLPEDIAARLTPAQFKAILAHELCHVRRLDNLTSAIHMIVEALFWFYPLVWWIGERLVEERERACDEEVLRLGSEPEVYAAGILNVCKFYLETPLTCAPGVTGSDLKRRIEAIMTNRILLRMTFARKLVLAAAGFASVAGPIGIGIVNAPPSQAQSQAVAPTSSPTFEVASIRPAAPQTGRKVHISFGSDPGRINYSNVSLSEVLQRAYRVRPQQVTGPSWLNSDRFDIVAKLPEGTTNDQVPLMLQNLVIERFNLTLRREKKEMPVYALAVGKNGPKLEKAEDSESASGKHEGTMFRDGSRPGLVLVEGYKVTLSRFADMLSRVMDRPVVDQTEIQGIYNFTFEVSSEDLRYAKPGAMPGPDGGGVKGEDGPAPESAPAGSLFSAIQKLGLKLEARKAPLDFIIIDKGERVPTEN